MSEHPKHPREIRVDEPRQAASPRGPRAFDLGPEAGAGKRGKIEIEEQTSAPFELAAGEEIPKSRDPGFFSLSSLFWTAASLLFTLYLADAAWSLVVSLEAKSPWVGQFALGLIGIVALGVFVFVLAEIFAMVRMRKVTGLRARAEALLAAPDQESARKLVRILRDFYARDANAAAGRAEIDRVLEELHEPKTLLVIAERALLKDKDDAAQRAIAASAQRVSVVTALSPRAIVDVVFVLTQSVGLIRRLSTIYGGRASGFGLMRLTARVLSHLAVTGGMAMADTFISQILGAGLAARLSAKLGEGVLNGVLTARVGIAAIDLCRPLPFVECEPVILSEVVKNTIIQDKIAENPAA